MERIRVIQKISEMGIVAVIRADSREETNKIVDAVLAGGISVIEITLTIPDAVEIIQELSKRYRHDEEVLIGAGTILDPETARACIQAGASFIVSPCLNPDTIRLCNRYRVAVIPGIMTVKEAVEGLELGAEILKVFPSNEYSPSVIKALKGPLPQGNFMPTGGVSLENAKEWIKAGAIAIGTGSDLTKGAKKGDFGIITKTAAQFVEEVKRARESHE